MIEIITPMLIQYGFAGCICLFFMWKDIKKDSHIVKTLDKIAIIIDERIPKQ